MFLVPSCLEPVAILATPLETDESASNQARRFASSGNCEMPSVAAYYPVHPCIALLLASKVHCAVQDEQGMCKVEEDAAN